MKSIRGRSNSAGDSEGRLRRAVLAMTLALVAPLVIAVTGGGATASASLEALALANTRALQVRIRMASLGAANVDYSFPAYGIHAWDNWQDEANRMLPSLSANIG
ncbi:hypothetical protein ACWEP5_15845 [Nocardia niigatensis]